MSDETRINGRVVRPSGSPAAQKPVVNQPANTGAIAQRFGIPVPTGGAGADEERVIVFAGVPATEQPTVFTAKNMWANLPKQAFNQVTTLMNNYYGEGRWSLSGGAGKPGVKGFWETAVDIARAQKNLGKPVSVIQAFDQILANSAASGLTPGGAAGGGGGGGAPQITKSVNLTDPGTAETLIDQALQQYLGRRASNDEVREFRKALRKAERGAPTEVDIEGDTQITSGRFNPATFAQQYAEGMEGAAEYQAATTFLDSFIESLGARVDVV